MTEPAITKRDCPDTKWRLEQSPTALALSLIALLVGIVWVLGGAWRWSKPAEIALSALVVAVLAVPVVRTAVRERMIRRRQTASPIPPGDSSANRAHAYRRRWGSTGVTFIEQTKTEEIRHGWLSRLFGAAPFHGVFLMVPVDEIIDANAEKLHSISTRFREQIGAARDVWSGNVPIYVVFTKPERLQGFLDCYAHLSKPDQGRVWTATFDQAADADVAKRFRHEFDALVDRLLPIAIGVGLGHHGSVAGEHAVRLPLALSELRKKLVTVLALAFRFDGESRGASLRGFFFTTRETKAQILKDLFERLVRPAFDARTRQLRFAVGGAALALAIGLFVPALRSHLQAREAIHDATKLIAHRWREEAPLQRKLASLDSMQSFLHRCKHDRALADDAFEDLCHAAAELYGKRVKHTFIDPCQARLEDGVRSGIASGYLEARTRLRLYLMLADTARLDRTWASGRLAQTWIEATGSVASSEAERRAIRQHIENYLVLLERGSIKTPALDKELIERARAALQGTPSDQIYFDMLIRSLDDDRFDDSLPAEGSNRNFPPLGLTDLLAPGGDIGSSVISKTGKQVPGHLTKKGLLAFQQLLEYADPMMREESWVASPNSADANAVSAAEKRYADLYVRTWVDLYADLEIAPPRTLAEAAHLYGVLGNLLTSPIKTLLDALRANAQTMPSYSAEDWRHPAFDERIRRYERQGARSSSRPKGALDTIPAAFEGIERFCGKTHANAGQSKAPCIHCSDLDEYLGVVRELRERLRLAGEHIGSPDMGSLPLAAFAEHFLWARERTRALLAEYDPAARKLLEPLLLTPITP